MSRAEEQKADYEVILAFDTDEHEFSRGFEAGALWIKLRYDPSPRRELVGADNLEMCLRMAESQGRKMRSTADDDEWVTVEFTEAKKEVYEWGE